MNTLQCCRQLYRKQWLMLLPGVLFCIFLPAQKKDLELWYKAPAKIWTDALPVGNGRLGGMVFGKYEQERIQLNEESVWAGSKINNNNPASKEHLKEIQEAIFRGDYKGALDMANQYMVGTPPRVRSYQPLGDLYLNYHWKQTPTDYKRSLCLNTGIAKTTYRVDGNTVTQEVFASAPQDIIIISIAAEKAFDVETVLSREYNEAYEGADKKKRPTGISLYHNQYNHNHGMAWFSGQIIDEDIPDKGPGGKHMRYAATMKILSVDGQVVPFSSDISTGFKIHAAKRLVLILTGATDYNVAKLDMDSTIDPLSICKGILAKATQYGLDDLKQKHIREHRSFFDRIHFELGDDPNQSLATDERLARVKQGATDNMLVVLYYQYGRYLLMNSSRKPGRLPANLQGIWNDLYDAPWNADFHTNINLQMNYWPAETGNLSETSVVLSDFVTRLMVPGAVTAKEMYGAGGWTIHHLTDPFGRTGVMDGVWGITSMDGAWMSFTAYDHFEFTLDTAFLKKTAYPIMRGAVQFVLDYLVKSPEGYLVTSPSHSPENSFYVPNTSKKEKSQITYAPTVDIHIINALFNHFKRSAAILGVDQDWVKRVNEAQKQLPPVKIGANGTIQEWINDYEEVDPGHRHISHLLGLYPLNLINPQEPALFEAARKTIERRLANGGGHTGWSKAWIVNLYARLLEPEKAMDNLNDLLRKSTLTNLFDTHPPFQIDGNFGGTAAIAEMLLQSQNGTLQLLPALPAQWPDGAIEGLHARGACTVNLVWKNGMLTQVVVKAEKGGSFVVEYKGKIQKLTLATGKSITLNGMLTPISP